MKHVKVPHLSIARRRRIGLVALLLLAIALWIVCIVLLLEITRMLLDTIQFIVDLAQMS
jgi:hypothetical protein